MMAAGSAAASEPAVGQGAVEAAAVRGAAAEAMEADSLTQRTDVSYVVVAPAVRAEAETAGDNSLEEFGRQIEFGINRRFLPTSRRIDREINKNKFVYRGETMVGLTASYGTLSSEDADMFPVFDGINLSGTVAAVNPFIGYFYTDNNCIGLRCGYSHISGRLDSFGVNLGSSNDLDIEIPWLDLKSNRFSVGLFHRSYVALDERGRFGAFGEAEVSFSTGENIFAYKSGDAAKHTESNTTTLRLLFSPGLAVYAFPNVCMSLSFGLGGFKYTSVRQFDEAGVETGRRQYSKLDFRLNLADIRIGMTIHLWNKKRDRKIESR